MYGWESLHAVSRRASYTRIPGFVLSVMYTNTLSQSPRNPSCRWDTSTWSSITRFVKRVLDLKISAGSVTLLTWKLQCILYLFLVPIIYSLTSNCIKLLVSYKFLTRMNTIILIVSIYIHFTVSICVTKFIFQHIGADDSQKTSPFFAHIIYKYHHIIIISTRSLYQVLNLML